MMLRDAVNSVVEQDDVMVGEQAEIIIADDGTDDSTSLEVLDEVSCIRGISIVHTAGRRGPSAARNLAADFASGVWLSFLDADDYYTPDALAHRLELAEGNPEVDAVCTDYAEVSADGDFSGKRFNGVVQNTPRRRAAVEGAFDGYRHIVLTHPVREMIDAVPFCTDSIMIRRSTFNKLGGFPVDFQIAEDIHLWLRVAASSQLVFSPKVTACCRVGHASLSRRVKAANLAAARCFEHLARDPLMWPARNAIAPLVAASYLAASYDARQAGDRAVALRAALRALRWQPMTLASWRGLLLALTSPLERC